MWRRIWESLRNDAGGISTYVAQAVMVLAVLGVSFLIIATTTKLGQFMVHRIVDFIQGVR